MNSEHLSPDEQPVLAIIGLGYVGLPLALAFSSAFEVIGYDIRQERIEQLLQGVDHTRQVDATEFADTSVLFTSDAEQLARATVFIVTVPTPVDSDKRPDLLPLFKASSLVGRYLKKGGLVIYESTVYPGCTEEECVPVLEKQSRLRYNEDFFCGYSPERISPGDKVHHLANIVKITSGSTSEAAERVDRLYARIITAGTYKAPSIKVAEAAKAIENAQRDVNISFMNELALMFDGMGIDTLDVIEAAATKWNFMKFRPGLVGGHCIGVDPYYLAYKAEKIGYQPQVILSGRRINDFMGTFVVNKVIKLLLAKRLPAENSRHVLILGITFKENCPDIRNSQVPGIYYELREFGFEVDVFDPCADKGEVASQQHISLCTDIYERRYAAVIVAVGHEEFRGIDFQRLKQPGTIIFDACSIVDRQLADGRL